MRYRRLGLLSVVMVLVFVMAGCGSPAADEAPPPGVVEEAPPGVVEEAPPDVVEPAEANLVQVFLVDGNIDMPSVIPAGPTTFEVTNDGSIEHNFEIVGQGISEVFDENLQPGEFRALQVDLEPGEYTVYCPVDDHREQGMELIVTVTGP